MTIQKNDCNKKGFSGHAEYFFTFRPKKSTFFSGRGVKSFFMDAQRAKCTRKLQNPNISGDGRGGKINSKYFFLYFLKIMSYTLMMKNRNILQSKKFRIIILMKNV